MKRAVIFGVFLWAIIFILGSLVMAIFDPHLIGKVLVFINPFVIAWATYFYLKKKGLEIWIASSIWVVVSIVLDLFVLVWGLRIGFIYFSYITVWIGYLEIGIVPLIMKKILKKSRGRGI